MKRQFLSGEDVLYNFMQAWKQDHVTEYNAIEKKSYGIFIRSQILLLEKKEKRRKKEKMRYSFFTITKKRVEAR